MSTPPGLNKRQRKRWRQKQRKQSAISAQQNRREKPSDLYQSVPRKHKSGQKATNVPSYSTTDNVRVSFERFSAFLRKKNADSSDDGSGSDSADEIAETAPPVEANDQEVGDNDRLPTSLDVIPKPASRSVPSYSANVGIKRQTLGSRRGSPPRSLQPPDPFYVTEEDSLAVMQDVDEITDGLLSSTRSLPAGKRLTGYSGDDDGKRAMVTKDSSTRRLTHLMTRHGQLRTKRLPEPLPSSQVVTCNSMRLAGTKRAVVEEQHHGDLAAKSPTTEPQAQRTSSSSLSELSRSPSPPADLLGAGRNDDVGNELAVNADNPVPDAEAAPPKKRKMTGRTSKHFSPQKRAKRASAPVKIERELLRVEIPHEQPELDAEVKTVEKKQKRENATSVEPRRRPRTRPSTGTNYKEHSDDEQSDGAEVFAPVSQDDQATEEPPQTSHSARSSTKKKRKTTGKRSIYFTPTKPPLDPAIIDRVDFYNSTGKKKRVPAGTSTAPVPPITSARFGIIQEKLWQEPFWLLIAVTFLNKTAGRAAVPIFWQLKERYPTPELLADAKQEDLLKMIWHLGLQTQRSKRLIKIARAWVERPPVKGVRWRTLHYPVKGDGKGYKGKEAVEEDAEEVGGALEIGHIPGCGPYAWDSWRIFCRDKLRGVAQDYNGQGAEGQHFVPEWQKVLPLDKELRACLRWMWLREGWIWDHETGERREATEEEMQRAAKGEMDVADAQEMKFAARAAGVDVEVEESPLTALETALGETSEEVPLVEETDVGVVGPATPAAKTVRRSERLGTCAA